MATPRPEKVTWEGKQYTRAQFDAAFALEVSQEKVISVLVYTKAGEYARRTVYWYNLASAETSLLGFARHGHVLVPLANLKAVMHHRRIGNEVEGHPLHECLAPDPGRGAKFPVPRHYMVSPQQQDQILRLAQEDTYHTVDTALAVLAQTALHAAYDREQARLKKNLIPGETTPKVSSNFLPTAQDVGRHRMFTRMRHLYLAVHVALVAQFETHIGKAPSLAALRDNQTYAHENDATIKKAVMKAKATRWGTGYNDVMAEMRGLAAPAGFPYPELFAYKDIAYRSDRDDGGYSRCFLDLTPIRHHGRVHEAVGKVLKRAPAAE